MWSVFTFYYIDWKNFAEVLWEEKYKDKKCVKAGY